MTPPLIRGFEVVIGLEVHAQVVSKSKLFSGAATAFGAEPNSQVSLVDAAMPGMLPVPNRECIRQAVRTGLAINAQINKWSRFDRKNYFYADLPQGYQISQLYHPLVGEGRIEISLDDKDPEGSTKTIGIERIHMEEDAGKLVHPGILGADYSLVDLNRAGTPLIEIVSEPDMASPEEALAYMVTLKNLLEYLEVSDCKMQEGRLRFEVNISMREAGSTKLGTKVEIKNLNSMKTALKCIDYEMKRQSEILASGGRVVQETRLWDEAAGETRAMRSKEFAHDYRYFPEPDLVPVIVTEAQMAEARAAMGELPQAQRKRLTTDYGLSAYDAQVLVAKGRPMVAYFEAVAQITGDGKTADAHKLERRLFLSVPL